MDVKPVQPENAPQSMLVTLSGIVIEVKPVHRENAKPPILVTPLGITRFVMSVPFK